jgi:hypothetical protein
VIVCEEAEVVPKSRREKSVVESLTGMPSG